MATSSQYVAAKSGLLTLVQAKLADSATAAELSALGVNDAKAFYAWPGGDASRNCIFLGAHPDLVPNPLLASAPFDSEDPVMKAGRRQRQQEFDIEITCWAFCTDLTPSGAAIADSRGEALFNIVDDVVADNVKLGLATIQGAEMRTGNPSLVAFDRGWASVFRPVVRIDSRLT